MGWYKSYIQENFVFFGPFPFSPSLSPTPAPSPSCPFYLEIWPEMTGPRKGTGPSGESIYRPAEPIPLPRAFRVGDRETESVCWWMMLAQRSYGVRAEVFLLDSFSFFHMSVEVTRWSTTPSSSSCSVERGGRQGTERRKESQVSLLWFRLYGQVTGFLGLKAWEVAHYSFHFVL